MAKTLITTLICIAGLLFTPTALYGQSGPDTTHEQDEVWEAVSIYVDSSECASWVDNECYRYADVFNDALIKNGYDTKSFSDDEVDYFDVTDSNIWEDGQDNIGPGGSDLADAIFFMSHGLVDRGEGGSCFLMGKDHGDEDNYGGDTCYVTTRGRRTPLWQFSENPWNTTKLSAENPVPWGPWMDFLRIFWPYLFFFLPHPGHISWGDVDANAAVNLSCHSCEFSVWENHGYKPGEFSKGQFNMYAGYHGSHLGKSVAILGSQDAFEEYMGNSIENNIGYEWVMRMSYNPYGEQSWGHGSDLCGAVVTYGKNFKERSNFFYNAGWKKFYDTGRRGRGSTYWAIVGCNPGNADEIDPLEICPQY